MNRLLVLLLVAAVSMGIAFDERWPDGRLPRLITADWIASGVPSYTNFTNNSYLERGTSYAYTAWYFTGTIVPQVSLYDGNVYEFRPNEKVQMYNMTCVVSGTGLTAGQIIRFRPVWADRTALGTTTLPLPTTPVTIGSGASWGDSNTGSTPTVCPYTNCVFGVRVHSTTLTTGTDIGVRCTVLLEIL